MSRKDYPKSNFQMNVVGSEWIVSDAEFSAVEIRRSANTVRRAKVAQYPSFLAPNTSVA